jgi:hypothetical protein
VSIATNAATDVTSNSANLHAYATPSETQQGLAWFEYGTDSSSFPYSTNPITIPTTSYYRQSNSSPFVTFQATNLNSGTNYYFRAVIRVSGYTSYGQVLNFTTASQFTPYVPGVTYINPYTYIYTNPGTQYVYQQPQVVYVNDNVTPDYTYSDQQSNNFYTPYYNVVSTHVLPPGQTGNLSASALGTIGTLSGTSLFGAFLLAILVVLIAAGFVKGAF